MPLYMSQVIPVYTRVKRGVVSRVLAAYIGHMGKIHIQEHPAAIGAIWEQRCVFAPIFITHQAEVLLQNVLSMRDQCSRIKRIAPLQACSQSSPRPSAKIE